MLYDGVYLPVSMARQELPAHTKPCEPTPLIDCILPLNLTLAYSDKFPCESTVK